MYKKYLASLIHPVMEKFPGYVFFLMQKLTSRGLTIRFPHSPDEKVHIQSVARFWDLLVATLKAVPEA